MNDAPIIANSPVAIVSEEGLVNGIADTTGTPSDTTNATVATGTLNITDVDSTSVTVTLVAPTTVITSNGATIVWSGAGTNTLVGKVGTTEIMTVSITNSGAYTVTLKAPIDHTSTVSEDIKSFDIGVRASDGSSITQGILTINVEDDAPITYNTSNSILIAQDTISINDLKAGFVNDTYDNGTSTVTRTNMDSDTYNDKIEWGNPAGGSGKSGYVLVDNSIYVSSSGVTVAAGDLIKFADFTHNNFPIYGDSSTLNYTDMVMTMDVVINGVSTNVSFTVRLEHTETPNDGADPRDIITLPSQTVTVNIAGQEYSVNLEGFKDASGNLVNTIYTNESTANNYGIYGTVTTTETLPSVSGTTTETLPSVSGTAIGFAGADGTNTNIVWGNTVSSYGTFTGNADGTYTFVLNEATHNALKAGNSYTATFSFSMTDKDGDTSTSTVTINLSGYNEVQLSATTAAVSASSLGLSGEYFGYNDNRTGTTSDPLYQGRTSVRLHSDDGTADAGTANNVDTLADVEGIIEGRNNDTTLINSSRLGSANAADATFTAYKLEYGLTAGTNTPLFDNDLGQNNKVTASNTVGSGNNLYTFLKGSNIANASTIKATSGVGDTTDAIIRMVGYVYVTGGTYDLRVTGDNGYRILIGGQVVAQKDQNQSTLTDVYAGKVIADGWQAIEILYWDQAGHASFRLETKLSGSADSTYQIVSTDSLPIFNASTTLPILTDQQDLIDTGSGTWSIRTGATYNGDASDNHVTGTDGKDKIHGGDGDDTLNGGANKDWLYGDAGNDTLTFDAKDAVIDGGSGVDTLVLPSATNIDFSTLDTATNPIKNIEVIDLGISGTNTLSNLSLADVIDMTDSNNDLYILGNTSDSVDFEGSGWIKGTSTVTETVNGTVHTFDVYTNAGDSTVTVKVEQLINDTI